MDNDNRLHRSKSSWWWIAIPILVFAVLRLPTVVHSPGMQDEQWFAVPGWTVWNEGVPRIPYVPTRHRDTLFENADRCLMTLPPALHYFQAPFHAVFSPGYSTSRLPLFFGALISIAITFGFAKRIGASTGSALLAALLMAVCRPLMFTGTVTRPDLLCAVCGWSTIILLWRYFDAPRFGTLVASGLMCGLGGLFHPFAIVFAMQSGVAMVAAGPGIVTIVKRLATFGISCAAAISLWVPLVIRFPEEFRSQFFANVIDRAGPGLPSRLIWPWPSIDHHAGLLMEFVGPWQLLFFGIALVGASWISFYHWPRHQAVGFVALLWSSVFLTAVVAGIHPTKGYWVYPCVWILAGLAIALDRLLRNQSTMKRRLALAIVAAVSGLMMFPGCGIRSTYLYLTHWGDPSYHGRAFIADVLSDLPEEGLFLADLSYVYDIYLSGRTTILCQERAQYWGDQELDYEAILLAWEGNDANWPEQYNAIRSKRIGSDQPIQKCFVDIYKQKGVTDE
ncbi:ArnT family glycosyltransferase [Rubripirellula tenax]|nr:glycosyltransferase family 39 protein [Rubripirellula tenax]